MAIVSLNDADFAQQTANKPVLVLVTNGDDKLRGDFKTAFNKASDENKNILFGQVNPDRAPDIAEKVNYQQKSLLIGLYNDEIILRRSRPWGSDLPGALQTIKDALLADTPVTEEEILEEKQEEKQMTVLDKPMAVTDATFEREVIDASHNMPVLVDFWAEWCGPCKMVAPILDKLAGEFAGEIRVAKVDTDQNPALSQAFQIRSIPTIAVFKQGKLIFMQPGAFPEPAFRDLIQQAIAVEIPAETKTQQSLPEN